MRRLCHPTRYLKKCCSLHSVVSLLSCTHFTTATIHISLHYRRGYKQYKQVKPAPASCDRNWLYLFISLARNGTRHVNILSLWFHASLFTQRTEFLFNNLSINLLSLFHYFCYQWLYNLAPCAWGRELKREYDAIASLLCSYACYSLQSSQLVSRPPCRSDTLNSVPHNKCSIKKKVLESG